MKKIPRFHAFTLIELLIVITIIGILAVALIPRITGGPAKARDSQRRNDLQEIAEALEFYASDYGGNYPSLTAGTSGCVSNLSALSTYLTTIPADPTSLGVGSGAQRCTNGYTYYPLTSGGASSPNGYLLFAELENTDIANDSAYVLSFPGSISNTDTAQSNLATMTLCSVSSCSAGAMIVIGR